MVKMPLCRDSFFKIEVYTNTQFGAVKNSSLIYGSFRKVMLIWFSQESWR